MSSALLLEPPRQALARKRHLLLQDQVAWRHIARQVGVHLWQIIVGAMLGATIVGIAFGLQGWSAAMQVANDRCGDTAKSVERSVERLPGVSE